MAIDPRKWDAFLGLMAANFRKLNEGDGLAEWAAFVENADFQILREAIKPLADQYAGQIERMEPAKMPTLQNLKRCYYRLYNERKADGEAQRYGGKANCAICGGSGWVWVLSPRQSDSDTRTLWPEDFRDFPREEFTGTETAPCPQCHSERWVGMDEQRRRAENNSARLDVYRGDRDFPESRDVSPMPPTRWGGNQTLELWVGVHALSVKRRFAPRKQPAIQK